MGIGDGSEGLAQTVVPSIALLAQGMDDEWSSTEHTPSEVQPATCQGKTLPFCCPVAHSISASSTFSSCFAVYQMPC